jgi:non-heme chloroperoxidase
MTPGAPTTITDHEAQAVQAVNAAGRQPVVFIHGLWLLPSSWDRWASYFEAAGYAALTPGWPDDPDTVDEARDRPEVFANKTIGQVADHFQQIADGLTRKPIIVGHSFGGLLAQILAGRGCASATVSISPAPFRGVLPLPFSALKSAWPVLGNPANRARAVPLTFDQFRYAFANAVDEAEAQALYRDYCVPAAGAPLFQSATANFNPWTEAQVDHDTLARGPMLIMAGEKDHTVPPVICEAAFALQEKNGGITELLEMPGRGHALTIDHGWQGVADQALRFVQRFVKA